MKKKLKVTPEMKDDALNKLMEFIFLVRGEAVSQSYIQYFLQPRKKGWKFDKKEKDIFFKWLRNEDATLKEIWVDMAIKVFKDEKTSKEWVDVIFGDYVERLIKEVNKRKK
jgi:hypothetical protein